MMAVITYPIYVLSLISFWIMDCTRVDICVSSFPDLWLNPRDHYAQKSHSGLSKLSHLKNNGVQSLPKGLTLFWDYCIICFNCYYCLQIILIYVHRSVLPCSHEGQAVIILVRTWIRWQTRRDINWRVFRLSVFRWNIGVNSEEISNPFLIGQFYALKVWDLAKIASSCIKCVDWFILPWFSPSQNLWVAYWRDWILR